MADQLVMDVDGPWAPMRHDAAALSTKHQSGPGKATGPKRSPKLRSKAGSAPTSDPGAAQTAASRPQPSGADPDEPQYEVVPESYNAPPRLNGAGAIRANRAPSANAVGVRDFQLVADSAKRAGDKRRQMMAHYCIGVLHDNSGDWTSSIRAYKQMLSLAAKVGDAQAQSVAFNCIGVALHRRGDFAHAIQFHRSHRESAGVSGQIVALCNAGLAHRALGALAEAEAQHRRALQLAIQSDDPAAESLASAQLGVDRLRSGTQSRIAHGRRNLERHAELEATRAGLRGRADGLARLPPLGGGTGGSGSGGPAAADADAVARSAANVSKAHRELGLLARRKGDYRTALSHLHKSRTIAAQRGDKRASDLDKCHMGVALGQQRLRDYLVSLQRPEASSATDR